jgi:hypothetical protein
MVPKRFAKKRTSLVRTFAQGDDRGLNLWRLSKDPISIEELGNEQGSGMSMIA